MRVYRVDVVKLPQALIDDPEWKPPTALEGIVWHWPRKKHYLAKSAAVARAALLESWGAEVKVVASNLVKFEDDDGAVDHKDIIKRQEDEIHASLVKIAAGE